MNGIHYDLSKNPQDQPEYIRPLRFLPDPDSSGGVVAFKPYFRPIRWDELRENFPFREFQQAQQEAAPIYAPSDEDHPSINDALSRDLVGLKSGGTPSRLLP